MKVIFAVAILQSLIGVLQYFGWLPFNFNKVTGIRGTLFYSNIYGCLMAIGLCINLYITLQTKKRVWKVLLLLPFAVFLITIFLSLSRTAILAALIGVGLIVFSHYNLAKRKWAIKYILWGFVLFLAIAIGMFFLNTQSVIGRLLIWKISFNIFISHPFFGGGHGSFYTQYGNYQSEFFLSEKNVSDIVNIAGMTYQPFSEVVRIGTENGIIGLCLATFVLVLLVKSILKFNVQIIWVAIIAIILTFSLVSYPFTDITITTIFLTCICAVNKNEKASLVIKLTSFSRYLLVLGLTILVGFGSLKVFAIIKWGELQSTIANKPATSLDNYKQLYPWLPNNGSFLYNYGAELAVLGEYEKSLKVLKRASYYGTSVELYTELGNNYIRKKDYAMAEFSLVRAAYMVPEKFVPLDNLFEFYKRTNQKEKAKAIAQVICLKPIKVKSMIVDGIKAKACTFIQSTDNKYEN